eukprot:GFYU01003504.1.p1 GENE.GFYU01003504.1~~GFYU01003504.1.p1  ORF type:complete len:368 (-),score=113.90 GFYU01003504.1:25-1128(-)
MATVNILEAQRILAIFNELIDQMEMISYWTPDVFEQDFTEVDMGLQNEIENQKALGEEFVKASKSGEFTVIEDSGAKVRASARSMLRTIKHLPEVADTLKVVEEDRSYPVVYFRQLISNLKELTLQKLSTNAVEEKNEKNYMADLKNREKKATNEVKTLERELKIMKRERMKQQNIRQDHIIKLETELKDVKTLTDTEQQKIENTFTDTTQDVTQSHDETTASLQRTLAELETHLHETSTTNAEESINLRRKRNKLETEVENWISKYDGDLQEKTVEYDKISEAYNEELKQIQFYEEHFEQVRIQKEEEERKAEEERRIREEEEAKMRILHDAATRIQAIFRGHKTRKDMKNSKGKKGKKGKGKKKK